MRERRDVLDAGAVRAWCATGTEALHAAQAEIDALNVYPVPDGDTGTNLFLTMRAVTEAVEDVSPDAGVTAMLEAMARGALMGARGNSGVILSQLLRGCVDVFTDAAEGDGRLDGPTLHTALERGAKLAWQAVARPVEGTILTVARAAAERAGSAGPDLADVARAAADGAAEALEHTTEQLGALADAGVVDAGGRGLVVLLDALVAVVTGDDTDLGHRRTLPPPVVDRGSLAQLREQGSDEYAFEVMYLLDAEDAEIPGLRDKLSRLGDSLVIVGGDGVWNVHVHVNDVGGAVEAGIVAGRPHRVSVTHFATQVAQQERLAQLAGRSVVACTPGGGLATLFTAAGATALAGFPARFPTVEDVLAAIHDSSAREVVLLPNDDAVRDVAERAATRAREDGLDVAVVPTRASVQGLAALAVHDDARPFDDDVIAMTAAARATRHGEVTVAEEEALTSAGVCQPGDVLGFLEGDVAVIGRDVLTVAAHVVDRLLIGGGELVTLVTGADAPDQIGERLTDYLQATRPAVDTVVYEGGQPRYPLLVGVE